MNKIFAIIILLTATFRIHVAYPQWSNPVNISNSPDTLDNMPDITVDNNGVIHCVWQKKYNSSHFNIFYSQSEDHGNTWIAPEDISLNDTSMCSSASIVTDSNNNIYVIYGYKFETYLEREIHMKKYNGVFWEFTNITQDMPDSYYRWPIEIMDNNNRLFVFWWDLGLYFKTYENDSWSAPHCPYPEYCDLQDAENLRLIDIACDQENNLHCIGIRYTDTYKPYYFKYDNSSGEWSDLTLLDDYYSNSAAIDVDSSGNPHAVWGYSVQTVYSYYNGLFWSLPEQISTTDEWLRTILVDNNDQIHIFSTEETADSNKIVHYKFINPNWEKDIIDTSPANTAGGKKSHVYNDYVILSYAWSRTVPENADIFFVTTDPLYTADIITCNIEIINYPNPFSTSTNIVLFVKEKAVFEVSIYDIYGKKVKDLINGYMQPGRYNITWNCTDNNGSTVDNGMYICILRSNEKTITRKLLKII